MFPIPFPIPYASKKVISLRFGIWLFKCFVKNLVNSLNDSWKCIWKCNVNRETYSLIKKAKLRVESFERFGKGVAIFIKGIGVKW